MDPSIQLLEDLVRPKRLAEIFSEKIDLLSPELALAAMSEHR
jgi:hypothetical protein